MILKDGKIYADGLLHKGSLLINKGIIEAIKYNPSIEDEKRFIEKNQDGKEINCMNKIILPGIIDIHSHLRDMEQSYKETFITGTKAAAYSGITTVFNMPNTKPPAISAKTIKKWMEKAQNNIFVDVGFIAGVPKGIDEIEIEKIVELGVIGFKIYPLKGLSGLDWTDDSNIVALLKTSSKYQVPIFIHPDRPIYEKKRKKIYEDWSQSEYSVLELHNKLYPFELEMNYVKQVLDNYLKQINNNLTIEKYPIVHFCHISSKESYDLIDETIKKNNNLKISFEITPHHMLLSKEISLKNENYGKVLPPLREKYHSNYLFEKLKEGNVDLIGTDHAPHTLAEKSEDYLSAPSGFPGFETYPRLMLDKVINFELPLNYFVRAASENPAINFNLKNRGFIKEGYDADLLIVENVPKYKINPAEFKSKAKFSPYESFTTSVQIWKVLLRGVEINKDDIDPTGKIILRSH